MSRFCQFTLGLLLMTFLGAFAQNSPLFSPRAASNASITVPAPQSPIGFFRELLAMSPAARINCLTNRSPEAREHILAKVQEYELLPPEAREIRLRATELRWWLTPMLTNSPAERAKRLAQAPRDLQPLIQSRLEQWSILPPPLQEEYLANEQAMKYMTIMPTPPLPDVAERQQKIAEAFNRFFELTQEEKDQTLDQLSEDERAAMQETLKSFDKLPPEQRDLCVRNYAIFAGMSESERTEFLKNAERWSKMTPEERQEWRELVQQVPIWPAGWTPNQPPPMPPGVSPKAVATNLN
jgi:hypothetical protein